MPIRLQHAISLPSIALPLCSCSRHGTRHKARRAHKAQALKEGSSHESSCLSNTCMLQSMVLKNWPMIKDARKLKNTLIPCTAK